MLNTFYFKSPVLGQMSAAPDSWMSGPDGVTFEMRYLQPTLPTSPAKRATVTVFIPWSNIAYEIKEQAWD